jgi:hypothetical protein
MEILSQTVPEPDIMLGMLPVDAFSGTRRQSVAGVKLVMEFLEADLLPPGLAHSVKLGRYHRVLLPSGFAVKKIAEVGGGGPFYGGDKLSDLVSAKGHSIKSQIAGGRGSRGISPGKGKGEVAESLHLALLGLCGDEIPQDPGLPLPQESKAEKPFSRKSAYPIVPKRSV